MKILIIRTHGSVVDINTYNSQDLGMAKAFIASGNKCDIVYFGGNKKTHKQIIRVDNGEVIIYWVKGVSIALNGIFFGLDNIIREYDVVQVGDYDQLTSLWLMFFSRYRYKTVLYHGPYLCEFNKKYRMKCKLVDLLPLSKRIKSTIPCFAKSGYAAMFLKDRGFKNITTVGVGLDKERFCTDIIQDIETQNALKFISKSRTLLYVGRIERRRNIFFLIDLLRKVKETYSDVNLILIGNGDENYKSECFAYIESLGLKDSIYYISKMEQSQLVYIYEACSVFLLPTSYEIFGMVLMEAMYYGLPVITTNNGGSSILIDHNNGIVCDLDIETWNKELVELLGNENKRLMISKNAKTTIERKCSWDVITKAMLQKYPLVNDTL